MVKVLSYLLCSIVLTLLCLCTTQPNNTSQMMQPIKPVVLWKTAGDYPGPEEVDSMRLTVFSSDGKFTDTIQEIFHFDNHQAIISVPAGSRFTLKVEGLNAEGEVIYKGTVQVDDASDQDITIILYATHVTPENPQTSLESQLSSSISILAGKMFQ